MFKEKFEDNYFSENIEIKKSSIPDAGLGCFAKKDFNTHECIEIAPVLIFNYSIFLHFRDVHPFKMIDHILVDYVFRWPDQPGHCAIAFGYGSIYNHADTPNVQWRPSIDPRGDKKKCQPGLNPSIEFWSKRKIKKGEELFIKYHPDKNSKALYFLDDKTLLENLNEK